MTQKPSKTQTSWKRDSEKALQSKNTVTGHIADDGTVVFFAIVESGPVSKGPNAIKNGFRQMAREPRPFSNKRGPKEEKNRKLVTKHQGEHWGKV